jgi:hypothetical protein
VRWALPSGTKRVRYAVANGAAARRTLGSPLRRSPAGHESDGTGGVGPDGESGADTVLAIGAALLRFWHRGEARPAWPTKNPREIREEASQ